MAKRLSRKGLSASGLLREVRACFEALDDPVQGRGLCLAECLMSGLAVFGLKYPSLLQFDRDASATGRSFRGQVAVKRHRATPRGWCLSPGRLTSGCHGSGPPYAAIGRVNGNC